MHKQAGYKAAPCPRRLQSRRFPRLRPNPHPNLSETCGLTLTPALHLTAQERECERCGRTALAQSRIGEMQALLSLRDAQLKALVELQRAAALRLGRAYALLVLEWHPTP